MPYNTRTTAIVRGDLGVAVDEYKTEGDGKQYIAEKVLRPMVSGMQASEFPVVPIETLLSVQDTNRGMRGFYNRSDWSFEMGFYATREHGWEEALDEREKKLYADLIDAEMICVNRAMGIIMRDQEIRVAGKLFNTTNFTEHGLSIAWSAYSTATPIDDVQDAINSVRAASGMIPNALILPYKAYKNARRCDQVKDQLKYTFPGIDLTNLSESQLADVLGVEQIIVGNQQKNTAAKGQSAVLGEIWNSDYAMLTRIATSDDFSEPCIGRIFRWNEESGGGEGGMVVEEYPENASRSNIYRVRNDSDERLIKSYDDSGNVLSDISGAVSYLMTGLN